MFLRPLVVWVEMVHISTRQHFALLDRLVAPSGFADYPPLCGMSRFAFIFILATPGIRINGVVVPLLVARMFEFTGDVLSTIVCLPIGGLAFRFAFALV